MRAASAGFVLVVFAGVVCAQPDAYKSGKGKFTVKFPGAPKVSTKPAETKVGDLEVTTATYATTDGGVFMVSFTDFPDTKPEHHVTLLDAIRDGVKGRDGKVTDEKSVKFGPENWPSREFTVDKDKAKQRIRFRAVIRDSRMYQVAVIGTPEFANGKDATSFLESFELTK